MSYPHYTSSYNPNVAPGFPQAGPTSAYGGPPSHSPATHDHPEYSYGGYPQQPPYGGHPQQPGEPGFHASPPGGYNAQYAFHYAPDYGTPASQHGHPTHYPGATGYGAVPSHGQHSIAQSHSGSPSPYLPQGQHHGYGAPPPPQATAPAPVLPVRFTFAQKDGYDRSGAIKDAAGKVVYKLKDEADKHTWTAYLKSRPLIISRADGTKVALFHWKGDPSSAKLECYAVWGQSGGKGTKLKVQGDILDKDWKFKLPVGRLYEWDGPTPTGQYNLLDHQQLQGDGLDVRGKSVARYTPHTEAMDATIDILPEATAVPDLLDAAIMTSFQLEWAAGYSGTSSTGETLAALNQALQ